MTTSALETNCLLCETQCSELYYQKNNKKSPSRDYFHCQTCDLVFVPSHQHLSLPEQKEFYNHHQNSPNQQGYVQHLKTLTDPLKLLIKTPAVGLDYGSGPGPTLHTLLANKNVQIQNYDPLYAPHANLLQTQYDFITATEVVEHFTHPKSEWQKLHDLLKPNGILGIMTQFQPQPTTAQTFADWWYHRDVTHIGFYTPKTFLWIARKFDFHILQYEHPIVIFTKK